MDIFDQFIDELKNMQEYIYEWAKDKGFWTSQSEINDLIGNKIALAHGELSEALEAVRKGIYTKDEKCPEFTNFEIELADAIIRILDLGAHTNSRVAEAIVAKMKYNQTRPYKHGKKF